MNTKLFPYLILPTLLLPLVVLSCTRKEGDEPVSYEDTAELLGIQMDTKALPPGTSTYRIALFSPDTRLLTAQGTYCNALIDHTDTRPGALWIAPCRVDANGTPVNKEDGSAVSSLDESISGLYGLRASNQTALLAVSSPAKSFSMDAGRAYYQWEPDIPMYVSESVAGVVRGSYFGGMYVYTSSSNENLLLKDRRARIYVSVACGVLDEAYIQEISLTNRVNSARWYMTQGFSNSNYTTGTFSLYNCGGTPEHLVKANNDTLKTTVNAYLPSIDFSDATNAAMRPRLEIKMGSDTSHPTVARVTLDRNIEPMTDYRYYLYVSKSYVQIALTASEWDVESTQTAAGNETPRYLGAVSLSGWDESDLNTGGWNNSI